MFVFIQVELPHVQLHTCDEFDRIRQIQDKVNVCAREINKNNNSSTSIGRAQAHTSKCTRLGYLR